MIPLDFRPLWLEFLGLNARKGITISELRNRMIQDMQLAGLVEGTRREYLRAVRELAAYYMVSPDQLSERNVENYLLYVRDELGVAKGTFAPVFAGLKFFYLPKLDHAHLAGHAQHFKEHGPKRLQMDLAEIAHRAQVRRIVIDNGSEGQIAFASRRDPTASRGQVPQG